MAAVSAAMLRPPGGGLDPPYFATQMMTYTTSDDSKSKKTWGQRLKLGQTSPNSGHGTLRISSNTNLYGTVSGPGGSSLSKSMKYAETWLYGTVRSPTSPARPSLYLQYPEAQSPVLISTPQSPVQNYAVVVCSCPEYLNGTKKGTYKKVSVCKKCKGSRLPLGVPVNGTVRSQVVGGTMRGPPAMINSGGTLRAGTMKLQSTTKSRPTILSLTPPSQASDPYDLMRRTRLSSPMDVGSQFTAARSRAKSISPIRNRSRRRSPESPKVRSKSVSRSKDLWYEDIANYENELSNRRSILECDVNPYELMKKNKLDGDMVHHEQEDDDVFTDLDNDETFNLKKLQENLNNRKGKRGHNGPYSNVQAIGGQRIRVFGESTTPSVEEDFVYDDVEVDNLKNASNTRDSSPRRPPRKHKQHQQPETSEEESESDKQKIVTKQSTVNNSSSFVVANRSPADSAAIKSILKKPVRRELQPKASPQDKALSGSHFYLPTPPANNCHQQSNNSNHNNNNSNNNNGSPSDASSRKKVQFLVENEIVVSSPDRRDEDESTTVKNNERKADAGSHNLVNTSQAKNESDIVRYESEGSVEQSLSNDDRENCKAAMDSGVQVTIHSQAEDEGEAGCRDEQTNAENDSSATGRAVALRRSQSERLTLEGSPEPPVFMDTMALRPRPSRAHSRQVFISTQSLVEIVSVDKSTTTTTTTTTRPKDRPPPPPPPQTSVTIVCSSKADSEDSPRSTSIVPIVGSDDSEMQQQVSFADPAPPPRSRSRERKTSKSGYVKTRFVRDKRLLNVAESRTVHRLSISQNSDHEDDNSSSNEEQQQQQQHHKKTSIMISGDDCYSTVNVNNDTPIYQSSVTVNNCGSANAVKSSGNTVTISVYSESSAEDSDVGSKHSNQIYIHNSGDSSYDKQIETSSPSKTLVVVDYESVDVSNENVTSRGTRCHQNVSDSTTEEIGLLLRDPVEAVKRNLVPHVCGKAVVEQSDNPIKCESELKCLTRSSFVSKLLEDPTLGHLAEGLDTDLVAKLIENSLLRLKESRKINDDEDESKITESAETMSRLIDASLQKLQEERSSLMRADEKLDMLLKEDKDFDQNDKLYDSPAGSVKNENSSQTNNVCSAPYESMEYESGLMGGAASDLEPLSDCYNASASELSTEEENSTRSKFYQMLVDATLSEIEISHNLDDDHHYESIRLNQDPIYEEISDIPPPLPLSPPPLMEDDKKSTTTRSIFEGASKYDILSYLVDAKERGIVPEDSYSYNDENETKEPIDHHQRQNSDLSSRVSNLSNGSDSSEDNSLIIASLDNDKTPATKKSSTEIERNDSGVGSETSKCSRSRWQSHNIPPSSVLDNITPIHLCEDCDGAVETQVTESGVMFAPLVCRKCGKKRAERKEIITEIVETEEKYGRDLQIILEEFYQPMLVAGLLNQEQLSTIFLNVEELLENNQSLAERLRDALEIAIEQGDEDLLTVNIGKLMLECAPMLHAFTSYCVRQGAASMLLSSLEKEKELLRIFLKVSQMENTVLRRMNLNSFLMVPVQRVTKYPLLLSRLFKVTPHHLEGREQLRQAQQKIEQHLSHMNSEAKDVTTLKLWRRISSSNNNGRRSSSEMDMINIKLRKLAVDVLEWNHDEARFAMEGKLLFTQPNDNNWRKGRTIKLTPINALLVTNGKPTAAYKPCEARGPCFPRNTGVREASLVLARDKGGRTALLREPLYLDRCVVAAENDWDDYFELQEIVTKDTYIFKAEDSTRTKQWCQQLQYHCQGMGAWRKRRNALANIMINGMMTRN